MSDVSDILAEAALALREVGQHELADIMTLLGLLRAVDNIAAVRGAITTIITARSLPSGSLPNPDGSEKNH